MYAVSKTLGDWHIGCGKYSCFAKSVVSDSGETVAFAVTPAKRGAPALAAANASVLADALNVHETTGLTPSQLQARVAELEAALSRVQKLTEWEAPDADSGAALNFNQGYESALEDVAAALKP